MTIQFSFPASIVAALLLGCASPLSSSVSSDEAGTSSRQLAASADTTIFSESGSTGNGTGAFFFAGNNSKGSTRRGLLRFDLASLPEDATITDVSLHLEMDKTQSGEFSVKLHRLLASWGEGAASSKGGAGVEASPQDATWTHRKLEGSAWTTPGGDWDSSPSADLQVNAVGSYAFSSRTMVKDVQGWLDRPDQNHGWLILGDETDSPSVKRFCSRESTVPDSAPRLHVQYRIE